MLGDDHEVVAVADAAEWARRIAKHMPDVVATEVYDELVSVSDIAARAGVAPEAVRLWAAPQAPGVSSGPSRLPRQVSRHRRWRGAHEPIRLEGGHVVDS